MTQIIDKLLVLIIFVSIATALYNFYPYRKPREEKETQPESLPDTQPVVQQQMELAPVFGEREEITASPLFVRHLSDKATLMVRYRAVRKACTAHLIIWSGAKRKGISDSYYDLGVREIGERPSAELTDEIIDEFLAVAKERLDDLAVQGKRKRKATKATKQEVVVATDVLVATAEAVETAPVETAVTQPEQVVAELPQVTVEENVQESIKLKRFPSVYRGVITEVGMMKQSKDGREFDTFGVRYATQEGVVEAVFGANLRTALREAKANVGDRVEILKIGRKTIEAGKAPMNLFKVAKLEATA